MTGLAVAAILGTIPWLALGAFFAFGVREPRPLPAWEPGGATPGGATPGGATPEGATPDGPMPGGPMPGGGVPPEGAAAELVSVVVPARNEAARIERCLRSLVRQEGVDFEIIVVDDRSTDETARVAREMDTGNATALRVLDGEPLPNGWFGKPWACAQGARVAGGGILLFTDADTEHGPDLLRRALTAMDQDRVDALSLAGRQELGTFWERLVQPHVFALMALRFRRLDRVLDRERWREALANGQYVLVRRAAYEGMGGHGAVRGEVVEDLRLAQELTRGGARLTVRGAEDAFRTRMYTSLGTLVDGWTKNMAVGARQAGGWWGPVALPGMVLFLLAAWILPVVLLVVFGLAGRPAAAAWAGAAYGTSVLLWVGGYWRFGVPGRYAFLHPLGAGVTLVIALRSWLRGTRRIEWKGRRYGAASEGEEAGGKDAGGEAAGGERAGGEGAAA